MYEKKIPEMLDCGVSVVIKVLGGKWKAWILECIHMGIRRPSELHREISAAAPRVINLHLKELEDYNLITKTIYPGLPLKVEYFLTDIGESLMPVIAAMDQWGNANRNYVLQMMEAMAAEEKQS
ncbi:transcriptional regulator, HxlR family [Chitinophaga jiangningensis]|uniref:Transcriptional regulator, HxlR family n=1 Tax=Chitinophaga jiangningensis TaxID=1419482 RepID=A0A1M6V7V2_9BACT|nr:helix-turn-helix domain-containing protein [Chitinophaga jiangningensis]SHK77587.1 transcriptional regulator, HxlR family [Chitinophaga jiangningensis]